MSDSTLIAGNDSASSGLDHADVGFVKSKQGDCVSDKIMEEITKRLVVTNDFAEANQDQYKKSVQPPTDVTCLWQPITTDGINSGSLKKYDANSKSWVNVATGDDPVSVFPVHGRATLLDNENREFVVSELNGQKIFVQITITEWDDDASDFGLTLTDVKVYVKFVGWDTNSNPRFKVENKAGHSVGIIWSVYPDENGYPLNV